MSIAEDGGVTGTIHYVESYPEFSDVAGEQSGNYFPFDLDSKYKGKTISVQRNSDTAKESTDLWWILRIPDKDTTFTVRNVTDGNQLIKTLTFAKATLEPGK